MPFGRNSGDQLNVILFEVVMTTSLGADLPTLTQTVALHPILTVPTTLTIDDSTRSTVERNLHGAVHTIGGRALRPINYQGDWGVESRFFGPFGGTGVQREKRFYSEVVRLSGAVKQEDVDEAFAGNLGLDISSALLAGSLARYNQLTDSFAVNLYDFYNGIYRQVEVMSYRKTRSYTRGGATGNINYSLSLREIGPLRVPLARVAALSGLLEAVGVFQDLTDIVKNTDVESIIEGLVSVVALPLAITPLGPIADKVAQAIRLLGPSGALLDEDARADLAANVSTMFGDLQTSIAELGEAAAIISANSPPSFDSDKGAMPFGTLALEDDVPALQAFEEEMELQDAKDALEAFNIAGVFWGMGQAEYREMIESAADGVIRGPELSASISHVVTNTDTPDTLFDRFGVDWDEILKVNDLTPDEALFPGRILQIPTKRARGAIGIQGLAVFDSHVGNSVYGKDWDMEFKPTARGDLVTVEDEECLTQGMQFFGEHDGEMLLELTETVPPIVLDAYISQRTRQMLTADRRIRSVQTVNATVDQSGIGYIVTANVVAVNGKPTEFEVS